MSGMIPGTRPAAAPVPPETFTYKTASDRSLRASVEGVTFVGDPEFLPTDPNWLQIRVKLENVGPHAIKLTQVKARLADGTTVASATSMAQIMKPPSMLNSQMSTIGLGAGGMALGMIFPPAAIASGVAIIVGPALMRDRVQKKATLFSQQALRVEAIAPGTANAGDVFVPAVKGQTGLIVFYELDGRTQTLVIQRLP
jgi:hypothetical protein